MRFSDLTARDRRALLLGSAAVLPALVFLLVLKPYMAATEDVRSRLQMQTQLLERELSLVASAGRYPALIDDATRLLERQVPRLFGGSDDVTATSSFASYIGQVARRSRVLVQRSESLPAEVSGNGILALSVDIRAVGDLEGMLRFLHSLEEGEKLLHTDNLVLERANRSGLAASGADPRIALSATFTGYALLPTADKPQPSPETPMEGRR